MMRITSNRTAPPAATVSVGEKRSKPASCGEPSQPSHTPAQDSRKVSGFIPRYWFGCKLSSRQPTDGEQCKQSTLEVELSIPKAKRPKLPTNEQPRDLVLTFSTAPSTPSSNEDSTPAVQCPSYSVQRLRQFWNNRVLSGATVDPLSRKQKSATIAGSTTGFSAQHRKLASPQASLRFQRNGSIGRSGRRRSLLTLDKQQDRGAEAGGNGKRSSNAALLSPNRDPTLEKRKCGGSGGATTIAVGVVPAAGVRDTFPLATANPLGNQLHWARRTEVLGIRELSREEKQQQQQQPVKMPLRVEHYVNNYIGVDIQSVPDDRTTGADDGTLQQATAESSRKPVPTVVVDSPVAPPEEESLPPPHPSAATVATTSLGRKCSTPTRKISFLNNISPYNRRLLAGNGTKVAALTSKFNQMIQQDASLLEQVKRRGGYLHKSGNVAYKVLEDTGGGGGAASSSGVNELYGFASTSRNGSLGRSSLRKRNSSSGQQTGTSGAAAAAAAAASPSAGNHRMDESSDEISSVSSKNSSLRRTGVRKRPSLRKNIYRRPEWAESGHRNSSPGVRKMLEMFESAAGRKSDGGDTGKPPPGKTKPKVPDKSEQVLQKTKAGPLVKEKKSVVVVVAKESVPSRATNIKEMVKEATAEDDCESVVDGNVETTTVTTETTSVDDAQQPESRSK
ncbi:uncharacterized protein LOC125955725 [Anopheles darlingi]|uniref:uncharacterized protein LOC125955725 n=1 Tax=Anopheles darlingi TaxID=43151 RepID=UPI0020FFFBD4|nr:uncharacterized protein LOC125955725 [Anopheles darlingi]